MKLRLALALVLALAASHARAGTIGIRAGSQSFGGGGGAPPPRHALARICGNGDWQNNQTRLDLTDGISDDAIHRAVFKAMVDDEIAYHCDFGIEPGDFTDSTGGADQAGGKMADDPDSRICASVVPMPLGCSVANQNDEWLLTRAQGYDRMLAAGEPLFIVTGNHDSNQDFERIFPASEFLSYSWGMAVNSRTAPGASYTDTSHRQALFTTAIGTICVIGAPFDTTSDTDGTWMVNHIGCGASRPTIIVQHGGIVGAFTTALNSASPTVKGLIIGSFEGHFTPATGPSTTLCSQIQWNGTAGIHGFRVQCNWQETQYGVPGDDRHTGGSWWFPFEIDPVANTSTLYARNPYYGGRPDSIQPENYRNVNTAMTLDFNWCSKFGGAGC